MLICARTIASVALLLVQATAVPVPQTDMKPPMQWATVAIHPTDPNRTDYFEHDVADGIVEQGMVLKDIISQGYNFSVMPFRDDEISGLPDWSKDARFDILAKVDPDDVETYKKIANPTMQEVIAKFAVRQSTDQMLMMQSLMRERFKLHVHWEPKERNVYALTVAKGGLKLKPAADPKHGEMYFGRGHLNGKGVPLSFLAGLLAIPSNRTVVDKTGVDGAYDFELHYRPLDNPTDTESSDPDFFTAIQEQLGLKLQATKANVPVLVVDHVEKPTPN
jgi:uncharacterized protein (TIGR03435 family)